MKRFLLPGLTVILLWGLVVPLEGASDKPKRGGTLNMAIRKDVVVMNALVATGSSERRLRDLMFEALLGLDLKGNIHPNLAESWEVSDDGRLYTFKLRKGVKFHNGQEMTAEDAKFAMDYTMNPKNGARGYSVLKIVDRVEAADKYTLKVYIKNASPGFLYTLTEIQTFSVVPKESLPEGVRKIKRYPVGTGPFKFVEWQPKQRIVLERFDDYWGHKAFVDKVIMRPIKDATIRMTALRAGDIDMVVRAPYEWVKEIAGGRLRGFSMAKAAYAGGRGIDFNVADPPFNNKKLRLAVAHAIDRKEIMDAAYFGFGDPSDQKYPRGHSGYFEGVPSPEYDLNKAKALLKEAGYKGETIEIMTNQGAVREIEATTLQAQLKKIGMKIKLKVLERGAALSLRRKGKFAFKFGGGGSADPYVLNTYLPSLICVPDLKRRIRNETGYCDKKMDALLRKAETELNPDKRRALLRQIVTKSNEDLPELTIGFVPRFFVFADHVKGFTTDSSSSFRWWGGGLNYVWLDK